MKKCALYIILIAGIITACNTTPGDGRRNNDKFIEHNSSCTLLLDTASNNSPKYECNISIKTIESDNKERMDKINNSIIATIFGSENGDLTATVDTFMANIRSDYYDLLPEYLNEKHINENAPWFNFSYDLKTNVEYGRGGTIIYEIYNYTYNGGAHPHTIYTYINFNPESGNEIYLADIFKEGYEEYLCNRLTDALADKIGATSRKDIKEKGYLTFNDIYPTENFIMKKDSILFFYNTYDIAPYSMGTTTLGFTYDELSEIMK